jgi:hypothetical protein
MFDDNLYKILKMELSFERADILQVDPISNVGTVKLLPFGKKQKV